MTEADVVDLITAILSLLLVINITVAIITMFLERRDTASLWAWILVLTFLPVIGFVLYLFVGRRLTKRRVFRRLAGSERFRERLAREQRRAIEAGNFSPDNRAADERAELASLLVADGGAVLTDDNAVEIFVDGTEKFDRLIADIGGAEDHVHLLYYIFRTDGLGRRLLDALAERAEAGVEVRLLVDAYGGKALRGKASRRLRAAGGRINYFFPRLGPINLKVNYRTHRKLAVIDGRVGYIGGFNVGDEYLGLKEKFGYWRDSHLRIVGSAVLELQDRMLMDWNAACREEHQVDWQPRYFPEVVGRPGDVAVQIAASGPDASWERIKYGYLKMISGASESLWIQTPYFMPDMAVLEALKVAARSGVEVKIMIPDKPDHPLVYPATLSYADELVDCGAEIFIYRNGFLHAKTILADGAVCSVGSANVDNRSFRLNFEVNAFVYDTDIGAAFTEIYRRDLEHCTSFNHAEVYRHPLVGHVKEAASRLVAPLL